MNYPETSEVKSLIAQATRILIIQADNPDADSLGSSLALEQILGDQGKQIAMYCGIDIPSYLHYLDGWDRIDHELPNQFDLCIIVDASTLTLFDKLQSKNQVGWIAAKPSIILDHHQTVDDSITFAKIKICDEKASSTGEIIFNLAKQLDWKLTKEVGEYLMTSILGDTQGLSNELATANTHRIMADLIDIGVNRPALEAKRRNLSKMEPAIFRYKAKLIERTEITDNNRLAIVSIPQTEISQFSPLYNPIPLIQNDMLQITGIAVAIVMKFYDDGRITAAIRTNLGFPIADKIAEPLGGGGHAYASGFKVTDGRSPEQIKQSCLELCSKLLDNIKQETKSGETLQYSYPTSSDDSTNQSA
jgi:phosphoesterase RecJ-like protein